MGGDGWTTVVDGLDYPESLRWHDGALWFSDFYQHRVVRVSGATATTVVEVAGQPSGLGWLPDGQLVVVDMHHRRILRLDHDGDLRIHADLAPWCRGLANDLLVLPDGTAMVGHIGFDFFGGEPFRTADLLRVTPDGDVSVAASDLAVPNGAVLLIDRTIVVAETFAARLTAYDVDGSGRLDGRKVWTELPGASPDGIGLDGDGGIWVADAVGSRILHVGSDRTVVGSIGTPSPVFSCVIGDDATLYAGVADGHHPDTMQRGTGRILARATT